MKQKSDTKQRKPTSSQTLDFVKISKIKYFTLKKKHTGKRVTNSFRKFTESVGKIFISYIPMQNSFFLHSLQQVWYMTLSSKYFFKIAFMTKLEVTNHQMNSCRASLRQKRKVNKRVFKEYQILIHILCTYQRGL